MTLQEEKGSHHCCAESTATYCPMAPQLGHSVTTHIAPTIEVSTAKSDKGTNDNIDSCMRKGDHGEGTWEKIPAHFEMHVLEPDTCMFAS